MRGELADLVHAGPLVRITPAYAGRTIASASRAPPIADHPRVCGENGHISIFPVMKGGSPPRMRGEQIQPIIGVAIGGITPAYAGRTS